MTTTLTIGTHNLHDQGGRPTPFADIVFFTEAIADRLRLLDRRLKGYDLVVCRRQPDLAIAYRRSLFEPEVGSYRLAHAGREKVTPHRGTYVLTGKLLGRPAALQVEHRINAAFPPYVRGEGAFRQRCWEAHTAMTIAWDRELAKAGNLIVTGGDINTPRDVAGYRGSLQETGRGFDRLAASIGRGLRLHDADYLSRAGSDHPRVRAALEVGR